MALGFDGFKAEDGRHVINFCEMIGSTYAFRLCLDPEGKTEKKLANSIPQ